nr:hypothetical protein [Algoriphagus sp.]
MTSTLSTKSEETGNQTVPPPSLFLKVEQLSVPNKTMASKMCLIDRLAWLYNDPAHNGRGDFELING